MKSAGLFFWAALAAVGFLWPGAGAARAEGMFYVAPKVIIGEQKASFAPVSTEIKPPVKQTAPGNPGFVTKDVYFGTYPGPGMSASDSLAWGALAFGLDFHERFGVPLRLEAEISMKTDAKSVGYKNGGLIAEASYYVQAPGESILYAAGSDRIRDVPGVRYFESVIAYSMHTAFVNLYADWRNQSRFTPYAGGGLGAAFIEARAEMRTRVFVRSITEATAGNNLREFEFGREKATNFAWHLDAGVAFQLTDHMSLDLGYRYLHVGDVSLGKSVINTIRSADDEWGGMYDLVQTGPDKLKFEPSHNMVLGLRYTF